MKVLLQASAEPVVMARVRRQRTRTGSAWSMQVMQVMLLLSACFAVGMASPQPLQNGDVEMKGPLPAKSRITMNGAQKHLPQKFAAQKRSHRGNVHQSSPPPKRMRRQLAVGAACTAHGPTCGLGLECACGAGRRLFGAPAAAACTCELAPSPPPPPSLPLPPPPLPPPPPPLAVDVVFDGYSHAMTIPAGGGALDFNGNTGVTWARVAFASLTISGLDSPYKGVRATCQGCASSSCSPRGTHFALGLISGDPTGYTTWTQLGDDRNAGQYGFHPSGYDGDLCCGLTNMPSYTLTWDSSSVWELRIKSDGYVEYAHNGVVFGTSPAAVSTWPLHFGLAIHSGPAPGTCTNIKWLSGAEAAGW